MKKYCFGIDVGGTTVKCALFSDDGTPIDKWEIRTHVENEGKQILPDIAQTVLAKIQEKELDKAQIEGIGIGVPVKLHRHSLHHEVDGAVADAFGFLCRSLHLIGACRAVHFYLVSFLHSDHPLIFNQLNRYLIVVLILSL